MRKLLLLAASGFLVAACGGGGDDGGGGDTPDAGPPASSVCDVNSDSAATPAFPFDLAQFRNEILPLLQGDFAAGGCLGAGCHDAPNGQGNYNVWPAAGSDSDCPDIESFNAFYNATDFRTNPRNSKVITAINGTLATHPLKFAEGEGSLATLLQYIEDAQDRIGGDTDNTGLFDQAFYESTIDPEIHANGCTNANCHNNADGSIIQADFGLAPNPAPGSPEMEANFKAVTNLIAVGDIDSPEESVFYIRATDNHRGLIFSLQGTNSLRDWIKEVLDATGPGDIGCEPASAFNVGLFEDEIMPLLQGDVDYNDRNDGRNSTGCIRGPCHGMDRGAGIFYIDEFAPAEENVENFSCFVNLANPTNSQVLLCPLNLPGCIKSREHPGGDVFANVQDRNYQRLLSYIYATKNGRSPLDFAFFVRKINVIFNDEDAVEDGARNQTCATFGCHGIQVAGLPPSNGSNFGIIPEARNETELVENFAQAAAFTFFPDATQSSLFLYPTNEIANDDNDLATGVDHTGGEDFAIDDVEALDILKWAGGIFPNQDGFLQDVLVAGIFNADEIDDDPLANPETQAPRIFLRSGQPSQFNDGEWDGFFSDEAFIDFNEAFLNGVNGDGDSTAYASFYITNADSRELEVNIEVESPNEVELFVGEGNPGDVGNGAVARTIILPSYEDSQEPVRILVKVFQAAGDAEFGFSINFQDENNNPLNNINKQLVVTLSNINAGI